MIDAALNGLLDHPAFWAPVFAFCFLTFGAVVRARRSDYRNLVMTDAFTGGSIYSVLFVLLTVMTKDSAAAATALQENISLLSVAFCAVLFFFLFDHFISLLLPPGNRPAGEEGDDA